MTPDQEDLLVAGLMFLGVGVVAGWAGTYLWYGMRRIRGLNASPPLAPGPSQKPAGTMQGSTVPEDATGNRPAPAVVHGRGWVLIQWHCPRCGKVGRACRCAAPLSSHES